MSEDIINPNEEAAQDPRIDTQRQNRAPDSLSGDLTPRPPLHFGEGEERGDESPVEPAAGMRRAPSDEVYTQEESGAEERPPNEATPGNPTGDAHFYEMAPTSTHADGAMEEIEEDFENDED